MRVTYSSVQCVFWWAVCIQYMFMGVCYVSFTFHRWNNRIYKEVWNTWHLRSKLTFVLFPSHETHVFANILCSDDYTSRWLSRNRGFRLFSLTWGLCSTFAPFILLLLFQTSYLLYNITSITGVFCSISTVTLAWELRSWWVDSCTVQHLFSGSVWQCLADDVWHLLFSHTVIAYITFCFII